MNPKSDPLEAQKEAALEKAVETLGEYYDSVRIFVTDKEESSTIGTGNFFAQYGQVSLWVQNIVKYPDDEEVDSDGQ